MEYCHSCLLSTTHPTTKFFKKGNKVIDGSVVIKCQACLNYEKRENIDWRYRQLELMELCDKHRLNYTYDCICAVSGGKGQVCRQVNG